MRVYRIVVASMALCSGLLFTSYLKAAEADAASPVAQMNRAAYVQKADNRSIFAPPRRPLDVGLRATVVAQMSPATYVRPELLLMVPHRPEDARQHLPVVAQSNRVLYDR